MNSFLLLWIQGGKMHNKIQVNNLIYIIKLCLRIWLRAWWHYHSTDVRLFLRDTTYDYGTFRSNLRHYFKFCMHECMNFIKKHFKHFILSGTGHERESFMCSNWFSTFAFPDIKYPSKPTWKNPFSCSGYVFRKCPLVRIQRCKKGILHEAGFYVNVVTFFIWFLSGVSVLPLYKVVLYFVGLLVLWLLKHSSLFYGGRISPQTIITVTGNYALWEKLNQRQFKVMNEISPYCSKFSRFIVYSLIS